MEFLSAVRSGAVLAVALHVLEAAAGCPVSNGVLPLISAELMPMLARASRLKTFALTACAPRSAATRHKKEIG